METSTNPTNGNDRPVDCYSAQIYSNGTTVRGLFETKEDCIRGMNLIAIIAWKHNVRILVTEIMKTHFHTVVQGAPERCEEMRRVIQRLLERGMCDSGRNELIPKGIEVSHDQIVTVNELRDKFMYVYRNSIAAGYDRMPWEYKWGAGNIYFVDHTREESRGHSLSDLSKSSIQKAFHTWLDLPKTWKYDDDKMFLPHSYMDWKYVEKLFVNPRVFISYLFQRKDVEARIDRECANRAVEKASETELSREAAALCRSLFSRSSISKATVDERMAIAQKLWSDRRTYSIPMLARVTKLEKSLLTAVFGGKQ